MTASLTWMIILLALTVLALVYAIMVRPLLYSAIGLAAGSLFLTIILFMLNSAWAAVFELSVCAGLITVVFISAIMMTRVVDNDENQARNKEHRNRFLQLPIILAAVTVIGGTLIYLAGLPLMPETSVTAAGFKEFGEMLWQERTVDIIGQIIVILAGAFGVAVLFKKKKERDNR
ncbi:MAG: hypothetical protein PHN47_05430 [Clostridia bacterium]|jgi:NADH-quinone oxidoreductase subunit J|nr:hypothetical protein [Clostridia bacterium]MDD4571904.1 hypothetical protein [Clostridia bacterium]